MARSECNATHLMMYDILLNILYIYNHHGYCIQLCLLYMTLRLMLDGTMTYISNISSCFEVRNVIWADPICKLIHLLKLTNYPYTIRILILYNLNNIEYFIGRLIHLKRRDIQYYTMYICSHHVFYT